MRVTIADRTSVSSDSYIKAKSPKAEPGGGNPAATADERDAIAVLRRFGRVAWDGGRRIYAVRIRSGVYASKLLPYLKRLPRGNEVELRARYGFANAYSQGSARVNQSQGEVWRNYGCGTCEFGRGGRSSETGPFCGDVRITGAGLAHLRRLTKMTNLNLAYTRVDDSGLKNLAEMKKLQWLDVSHTKVTNRGLQCFPNLRNAQPGNLNSTGVPGEGLVYLGTVKDVYRLDRDGSAATTAGVKARIAPLRRRGPLPGMGRGFWAARLSWSPQRRPQINKIGRCRVRHTQGRSFRAPCQTNAANVPGPRNCRVA